MTTIDTLTEKASEIGRDAQELGRSAGRRFDEARNETGEALHAAAASVRTNGLSGSAAIRNAAKSTADCMDATASYVEDHDLNSVVHDLRRFGRRHPAMITLGAVAVGMVGGAMLSRMIHTCDRA